MTQLIQIKRSVSATNVPSTLANGELAINIPDFKLFAYDGTKVRELAGSSYALLDSPVFIGNPTAPTPSTGDNTASIATTAFVKDAVDRATTGLDFQADVTDITTGTTVASTGGVKRYIVGSLPLDSSFGTINTLLEGGGAATLAANDIIQYNGTKWTIEYQTSTMGPGAICWDRAGGYWVQWDGTTWNKFGGLSGVTARYGLEKNGDIIGLQSSTTITYGNDGTNTEAAIVNSSATDGQVLLSAGTVGTEATWGALPLSNPAAVTGQLPVVNGGTGASTFTTNGVVFGSSTGTLTSTASASQYAILRAGSGGVPEFALLDLVNSVSGILPVINGGTGVSTITSHGVMFGNGTDPIGAVAPASQYQVLQAASSLDPVYGALRLDQAAAVAGILPVINGGTGQSTFTINGVLYGNGTLGLDASPASTVQYQVLNVASDGTPVYDAVHLDQAAATIGILPTNRGGTGRSEFTVNGIVFGNDGSALNVTAAGSQYQVLVAGSGGTPAFGAIDLTQNGVAITGNLNLSNGGTNNDLSGLAAGDDGKILAFNNTSKRFEAVTIDGGTF